MTSTIGKLLSQYFILNKIAFNVFQTPSFIHFVKALGEYGLGYKASSYSTLRKK